MAGLETATDGDSRADLERQPDSAPRARAPHPAVRGSPGGSGLSDPIEPGRKLFPDVSGASEAAQRAARAASHDGKGHREFEDRINLVLTYPDSLAEQAGNR